MAAKSLPDKSREVFIAAPVFKPKMETIPNSIGKNTRGIRYLGIPALNGSVMAAIEPVNNAVPITWKKKNIKVS